jgi:hypothetical protein
MITGVQPKILVNIDENGEMHIDLAQAELMGLTESKYNWKLVREHDGLSKQSMNIMWLEWTEEGRFKAKHDDIAIGRSLIMSPFNDFFTWQTTQVTEITEQSADLIVFKTKNSNYTLRKLYAEATGNPV